MSLPSPNSRVMATWLLQEQIESGTISFEAEYQRKIAWDTKKMSCLVDSIFKNYFIPPILFSIQRVDGKRVRMVIDGKQRLTAIYRFMNNEFGYADPDTEQKPLYYSKEPKGDNGLMYLSEDHLETFNSFQFVCVEYDGLTVDQEYDVFSRVQMGIAITTSEKLWAHNTPIAIVCKDLVRRYPEVKVVLSKKNETDLFQMVLHMFLTLRYEMDNFHGQLSDLKDFVKLPEEIPIENVEVVKRTLTDLRTISINKELQEVFTKKDSTSFHPFLKNIEAILFMLFQKEIQRPRSIELYANDFKEIRRHLRNENTQVRMGKGTFLSGIRFVKKRLEDENLVHAALGYDINNETDDEYESLSGSESPVTIITINNARPRNSSIQTAKRGGKVNTRLLRR